jgi:hypothetical protein
MQATEQKVQQTPQMTIWLSRAGAGLSVFVLALAFALSELWVGVAAVLAGGALWLLGHLRLQSRPGALASTAALVVLVAAAGVQVLLAVGSAWPVFGLAAALVAWDLDQFAQLIQSAGRVDGAAELERRHIRRLLIVAAIGGVLGAIGMGIRVRLSFELALVLAALAMLGLSIAVGFLRRLRD